MPDNQLPRRVNKNFSDDGTSVLKLLILLIVSFSTSKGARKKEKLRFYLTSFRTNKISAERIYHYAKPNNSPTVN